MRVEKRALERTQESSWRKSRYRKPFEVELPLRLHNEL
eukprot:COSAG05_NODE_1641_length_4356_cov_21.466761_2_plen_38_part_00